MGSDIGEALYIHETPMFKMMETENKYELSNTKREYEKDEASGNRINTNTQMTAQTTE
jgi:hypothetical protein